MSANVGRRVGLLVGDGSSAAARWKHTLCVSLFF